MYLYLLLLRILHIACGVFWAGTALMMVFYVFPAVERAGPDGGKILQAITGTNKFPQVLTWAAFITILTGLLLVLHLSSGFTPEWFTSKYGIALSTGGLTAFVAFLQVVLINRPSILHVQKMNKIIATRGGSPTEDERKELTGIRKKIIFSTRLIALWLIIAVVAMAGARYF